MVTCICHCLPKAVELVGGGAHKGWTGKNSASSHPALLALDRNRAANNGQEMPAGPCAGERETVLPVSGNSYWDFSQFC